MVKDLKAEQVTQPIRTAIASAAMIKGTGKMTGQDLKEIGDYIAKSLKESFTTYRINEVCKAIELGARGDLEHEGDMNVISPEIIFKWIHRFNDKYRREAIHKQKAHEAKLEKLAEENAKEAREKEFEADIQKLYNAFPKGFKTRNKGSLAACYRHMDNKGLCNLTNKEKNDIYEGIQRIRERVRWFPKPLIILEVKILSQYRALYLVFKEKKKQGVTKLF
jgi:hypothetical protein